MRSSVPTMFRCRWHEPGGFHELAGNRVSSVDAGASEMSNGRILTPN